MQIEHFSPIEIIWSQVDVFGTSEPGQPASPKVH